MADTAAGSPAPRLAPHSPLAQELDARRERYNALFAQARRHRPRLSPEVFAAHLAERVAPLAGALAKVPGADLSACIGALFELSLDLCAQELVGPNARSPHVAEAWNDLLPLVVPLLAAEPYRVAGSLTNAVCHLAQEPTAHPGQWLALMERAVPHCPSVTALLHTGQVAAWRCGLAHFRTAALQRAESLPRPALAAALSLPDGQAADAALLERLRRDPWFHPGTQHPEPRKQRADTAPVLRRVSQAGTFRGFGGCFLTPPVVRNEDGQFLAGDRTGTWLLCADAFGATLRRHSADILKPAGPPVGQDLAVKAKDKEPLSLRVHSARGLFPDLVNWTSMAFDGHTLAVTTSDSHAIVLLAPEGGGG